MGEINLGDLQKHFVKGQEYLGVAGVIFETSSDSGRGILYIDPNAQFPFVRKTHDKNGCDLGEGFHGDVDLKDGDLILLPGHQQAYSFFGR